MWCNVPRVHLPQMDRKVSVFSGESRVVQRFQSHFAQAGRKIVSVFSGESRVVQQANQALIEYNATMFQYSLANLVWCNHVAGLLELADAAFQYSLANLVWCNRRRGMGRKSQRVFQYSLANLVWCNNNGRNHTSDVEASFSILWRISCGATGRFEHPTEFGFEFQYSLANLVWCNMAATRASTMWYSVSVFSGESRVVQRKDSSATATFVACFSILWRISCGATS